MGEKRGSVLGTAFHNCLTLCRRKGATAKISSEIMTHVPSSSHIPGKGKIALILAKALTGTGWWLGSSRELV